MAGILDRLMGLETEYAVRFQSEELDETDDSRTARYHLYEAVRAAIQRRFLTVPAKHFKEGIFTANGGAVWFEAERPAAGGGLIEGATPECRGARQLIAYQRAQDRLLSQCAHESRCGGTLHLVKNDRDGHNNVYGAQENYEVPFAEGWGRYLWRAGLIGLFPLAALTWVAILGSVLATLVYFACAGLLYLPIKLVCGSKPGLARLLFGADLAEGRENCIHVPVWLETTLQFGTRILTTPLAVCLFVLLWTTAFRPERRHLLAFLVSRPLIAGAGMVCSRGKFHLADKAPAMNCVVGFGGLFGDRPIFSWGNFFKAVYAESWFSPGKYRVLFQDRQRLQIAMGDSNMCETAEFLRVGTTCLVLDAIESGWIVDAPRLKSPIQALRAICADPTLSVKVELVGGQRATALQIQRYYLEQVRGFLEDREAVPAEARQIVACWKQVLDDLEEVGPEREPPDQLVGQLDWVTKKYLLDHAAPRASWAERKKIDICYHELSSHGYYNMLAESELACPILDDVEIERAMRSAPADTPATTRGHYIREFARGDQPVTANWHSVFIGSGWDTRVIRLSRFGQGRSDSQPPAAETEKV